MMKIEFANLHSENDDCGIQRQSVQVQVKLAKRSKIPEVQMAYEAEEEHRFSPSRFVSMKINSLPSFRKKNLKFKTVIKINWYTFIYIFILCTFFDIWFQAICIRESENRIQNYADGEFVVRELIYVNFSVCRFI